MMDEYSERIFIHGTKKTGNPAVKAPREIYYDFGKTRAQMILDRIATEEDTRVTEAYAIFEYEGEAAVDDPRERQDPAIIIAIDKMLLSSPANNPVFQNTWYTFSSDQNDMVHAEYNFEFLQSGRPVVELPRDVCPEERIAFAGRQHETRRRALFHDDEVLLRALLDTIGH